MPDTDTSKPVSDDGSTRRSEARRRSAQARATRAARKAEEGDNTGQSPVNGSSPVDPPRPTAGPSRDLKRKLEEFFGAMALIPLTVGDAYSAQIIATRSGHLAEAWADLAKQSPGVKRALEALVSGGAWGGAIMASGSILIPIAGHYGLIPAMDPWAMIYGAPDAPTAPAFTAPEDGPAERNVPGRNPNGGPRPDAQNGGPMTAPLAPDQPPGVVTVAGSNNRAAA